MGVAPIPGALPPLPPLPTSLCYHDLFPQGVTERFIAVPEEIMEVIEEGKANRRVAVTSELSSATPTHPPTYPLVYCF